MASKAGQRLNADEVAEYTAYLDRSAAPPAKYDGVVFDNASGGEMHYRFATAEEERAATDAAKAAEAARADAEKLAAKVDAEIAKRQGADIAVAPPMPQG